MFKFNEQTKVTGKIAWRRGVTAGVQFVSGLPEAIARHLRLEPTSPTDDFHPEDWFLR
jgi:hypothetical protein